jgi:hypothetical protein
MIRTVSIAVGILATAALLSALLVQTGRANAYRAELASVTVERDTLATLAAEQSEGIKRRSAVINAQRAALVECAGQNQRIEAAHDAAERLLTQRTRQRDAALAELQRERETHYAVDDDAARWRAGAVPGGLSDRLRRDWKAAAGDGGGGRHAAVGDRSAGAATGPGAGAPAVAAALAAIAAAGVSGPAEGHVGPAPASDEGAQGEACAAAAGCYSNGQLLAAVDEALRSRGQCIDQLAAIAAAQRHAVQVTQVATP